MREVVLITEPEYTKAEAVFRATEGLDLRAAPTEETPLSEAVRAARCRAVIVGIEVYSGPLYEALGATGVDGGSLIARFGVGHDNISKPLAKRHRITVTNTPGALDQSVAEHAIWLMGSLARHIASSDRTIRSGCFAAEIGHEVRGKILGLLGLGRIGRRVAAIAHFGFGMRVLAADCCPLHQLEDQHGRKIEELQREWGLEQYTADVDAVLRQADFLSLHLPLNHSTRNFIDAEKLAQMKSDAMLINTSRGGIVNELALYDALAGGHIGGAALDVFEAEPYVPVRSDKDLRTLQNVVLTPHTASNTYQSNRRMADMCLANITSFFLTENKPILSKESRKSPSQCELHV